MIQDQDETIFKLTSKFEIPFGIEFWRKKYDKKTMYIFF